MKQLSNFERECESTGYVQTTVNVVSISWDLCIQSVRRGRGVRAVDLFENRTFCSDYVTPKIWHWHWSFIWVALLGFA